jgi:hypothetical protein
MLTPLATEIHLYSFGERTFGYWTRQGGIAMAFPDQHLPLSFEPLSPMKDEIIVPDSDTEYEGYRSAAKRRRIEELGRRYIAGHEITIVSARLKGPFDGSWKNPWHKRAAQHSFQSKDVKTIHGPKQGEERLSLPSAVLGDGDPNPKSGLEKRARALGMDKERYSFGAADDCAGTKSNATLGDEPKSASKSRPAITGDLVSKAFIGYTNFQPQPEDDYKRVKKSMKRRAESWLKAVKGSAYSKGGVASPPSPASDLVESPSMFGLRYVAISLASIMSIWLMWCEGLVMDNSQRRAANQ